MARKEFSKAIKVAKIKQCTVGGIVFCEECGSIAKRYEIDHIDPDGLTGEPVIENARLLCSPCHREKTALDVANIAKAKRREAKDLGVKKAPTLVGAPFPKAERGSKIGAHKIEKQILPPRAMFIGD